MTTLSYWMINMMWFAFCAHGMSPACVAWEQVNPCWVATPVLTLLVSMPNDLVPATDPMPACPTVSTNPTQPVRPTAAPRGVRGQ